MPRTTRSAQRSARSSDDDDTVVESRTHAGAAHTHVACDGDAPETRAQGGAAQEPDYMFDGGRSGAPAHSALSTERLLTTMTESFARAQADTNRILVETLRSLHHNGNQWNPVTSTPTASPTANTFTTFGGNFSKCTARFDGQSRNAEVLEAFVDAVEVYKECAGVSDEHALRGLSMLLTGDAAVWWRGARPSVGTCTYCKAFGHTIDDCRKASNNKIDNNSKNTHPVRCYGCGQPGVVRSKCETCSNKSVRAESSDFNIVKGDFFSTSSHPLINIGVVGKVGVAIVDTGATHSVASPLLHSLLASSGVQFKDAVRYIGLADGSRHRKMIKIATVPVTLGGRIIDTDFMIFPGDDTRTLLGRDFIAKAGMVLDIAQES
ncbi:hypothetical protein HF086_015958, partial [Spodoptera exigua]